MVAHLIKCCTVLALGFAPLLGQAPSKTGPELKLNNVIPQVLVNIKISTSSESLFLPYCGEAEGTPILCVLGAHLQVHSPQGWRPAKLRKTSGSSVEWIWDDSEGEFSFHERTPTLFSPSVVAILKWRLGNSCVSSWTCGLTSRQ